MADKDFKVKTGLDLPAPLPVVEGGTGQTSLENTRNALMPAQTGHSGKFISTDGTAMSWQVAPQQTATDGAAGYKVYAGNTAPTGQNTGDIWIDASTGNGIQLVRWRKTVASSTTTITGLDDNNLTLSYTSGNEQVYINGTLITRGQDYTATNGTSVVLTQAAEIGDTLEIFGNPLFSVTDTYTQAQANSLYVAKAGFDAAGKNYVINGGFDIWQRGTSLTPAVTTFTSYQADRWSTYSAANWTVSRQLTNDTTNLPNIQYCGRFQRNVGNTATTVCQIQNVFETANSIPLAGKTVTLSYYARRGADYSAVGNSFTVSIYIGTSTDAGIGSFTSASVAGGVAGALTTTWQRFTVTAAIPSTVTQIAIYTAYNPTGTAGANDYFEITGVQLEPGSVATPFSRNASTIQGELAECERYYEVIGGTSTAGITIGGIATGASQAFYFPYSFRTTKRTTPTLSKTGTWGVSNSIQPQTVFPQPSGFTIYGQSLASGAWYSQADSAAATIIASAEL